MAVNVDDPRDRQRPDRPRLVFLHEDPHQMGGGEVMLDRLAAVAASARPAARVDLGLLFGASIPLAPTLRARFRAVRSFDFPARIRWTQLRGLAQSRRLLRGWLTSEPTRACVAMTFAAAFRGALATARTSTRLLWMCNFSVATAGRRAALRRSAALRLLGLSRALAVCPSAATRAELERWGYPGRQLRVINNGVDLERHAAARMSADDRRAFRAARGVPPADLLAVCVARLDPIKNHDLLIRAVAEAGGRGLRVALICVGDAASGRENHSVGLRALARALGVADRVLFVGRSEEVPAWLAASDAAVLASHSEVSGLTLIEAAAAGLPLVSSRVGSAAELVIEGRTGYLFAPDDVAACADHLIRLARSETTRLALGVEARRLAEQTYDARKTERQWSEVFADLLAGPVAARGGRRGEATA